ncbi:hypothetical protein H9Y04_31470 [Streptomyces sp. TRM66268-LWL]|uniref:DUF3592 domain-containing protein n=1 Tax=Streptomyces polyasparticus TaxID=2767826 RepID=A0ABR7SNJ7_9ACTN|nr:DUF3592 domain-containing protein [Streptomyces polyasparticus]MBC9717061.1 hypothetical protein [Streptomyces polyasparticus]
MDFFFYAVPTVMAAFAILFAVSSLRRARELSAAWRSGLTAEARCLRAYTTTSGSRGGSTSTTQHHVYEFLTRDGRAIRFEEDNGPGMRVAGDIVTVHYTAERPERATAHRPQRGLNAAAGGGVLVFCGAMVAFCVFVMVTYSSMSAGPDLMMP